MISFRQLLLEHPDIINYRGKKYNYYDDNVIGIFSVVYNHKTQEFISISSKKDKIILSSDKSIANVSYSNYKGTPIHPDLLHYVADIGIILPLQSYLDYRLITVRPDIPVNGRVWKIKSDTEEEIVVSLWTKKKDYQKYSKYVDGCLKLLEVDPEECYYEFADQQNMWVHYDKIDDDKEVGSDETLIKKLLKIQHTSPEAKKLIGKLTSMPPDKLQALADKTGTTVAALRHLSSIEEKILKESPDHIYLKSKSNNLDYFGTVDANIHINFTDTQYVVAIVSFGDVILNGKMQRHSWAGISPDNLKSMAVNGKEIETPSFIFPSHFGKNTHCRIRKQLQKVDGIIYTNEDKNSGMRLYKYEDVYYASFWCNQKNAKFYYKEIKDCLNYYTNGKIEDVRFQFINHQDSEFISFEEAFGSQILQSKSAKQAEMERQLHLMPPDKKAEFLKKLGAMGPDKIQLAADKLGITPIELKQLLGRDIAENKILKEQPDWITVGPHDYMHDDKEAYAVFFIITYQQKYGTKIAWAGYSPHLTGKHLYLDGKPLSNESYTYDDPTHGDIMDSLRKSMVYNIPEISSLSDIHSEINGRLFKINNKFYVSFWKEKDSINKYRKQVEDCINFFTNNDVKNVRFQFYRMEDDEFVDYYQAFDAGEIKLSVGEKEAELRRQLHLMPPKKKSEFLKKLGADNPNKIQSLADKLRMTPIELKQLLGMDVAENSLGNLSFSDYHDPSIPYEAKPRTFLGFNYGTVFEYFYGDKFNQRDI